MDEDDCYCEECGGRMPHSSWGMTRCKDCRQGDPPSGYGHDTEWWLDEE